MSTNPLLDAENAVEDIGLRTMLRMLCTMIEVKVPPLALPLIKQIFEFFVFQIGGKIGHAGIRDIGNKIIAITTAHDAAAASDEAVKYKAVIVNPNATPQEKANAEKEFDDTYAKLIHFAH